MKHNINITGHKKGGSSYTPVEDPTESQSKAIVRIVDLLCEGEIAGLYDGAKSVYFNETVLQNGDETYNFSGVTVEERVGTTTQTYIPGISDVAANVVSVNTQVTYVSPVTKTVNDTDVDDVRVIISVPALFENTDKGDILKTTVELKIEVKPDGGGYSTAVDSIVICDKYNSTYQRAVRVKNLSSYGDGPWDVKLTRLTPDSTSSKLVNATYFSQIVEIKERKIQYRNSAIIGLEFDAKEFGNNVPNRAYDLEGLLIKVPDNRTWDKYLDTATYVGSWSGSFKTEYCDNPAWILYDLLTNTRYGLGLPEANVDKWGLYTIGVYNDTQVDDGVGGTERRYAFNGLIQNGVDAFHAINMIASAMCATPYWSSGLAKFVQDCPKDATRLVSAANVESGMFNYSSTALKDRYNVAYVTYNDADDFHRQTVEVVEDSDGIERYGYKPIDVVAYGCTSRGQAHRYGKWILVSQLDETEKVEYTAGFDHIDCQIGEIIHIADPHKSAVNRFGGRIVSHTSTSITIDSAVKLETGKTYSVEFFSSDGELIERNLSNTIPTAAATVLTWIGAIAETPNDNSMWVLIASDLEPTPYRVIGVEELDKHKYRITGIYYKSTKYAEIESGIYLPEGAYTNIPTGYLKPPTNIDVKPYTYTKGSSDNRYYGTLVSWTPSTDSRTVYYQVESKLGAESWEREGDTSSNSYTVEDTSVGTWSFRVRGVSLTLKSTWLTYSNYNIGAVGDIAPPEWIQVRGGGTTWSGCDCEVEWATCSGGYYDGETVTNIVRDYQLQILRSDDEQLLRTETVDGTTYNYEYGFNVDDNVRADGSGPARALRFKVWSRDIHGSLSSTYTTGVFTNPAPNMTGAPTVTDIFKGCKIDWHNIAPQDNDGKKYIIYLDTDSPPSTQVAEVGWQTTRWIETGMDTDSIYYAQIEPYDEFGAGGKSSVSDSIEPLKIATVDIDAELSSSITMSDSKGTTSSGLAVLYDRVVDSGGISYTSGAWVNCNFGIELFQEGIRVYTSASTNMFISYRRLDGDWYYLGGEADHTLNEFGEMISYTTNSGTAQTNYLTVDAGKSVPIFPQGIIAIDCRLHILSSIRLDEMIFIREVIAEQIVADNLAAISANLGTMTAGIIQSANLDTDDGYFIDLDDDEIMLGGTENPKFHWDGDADTLSIAAVVTFESASSGYSNLTDKPNALADINSTESSKLSGIEAGADVTATHTAANATNYTGNPISTSYTIAKCTDPNADQTSTHTSNNTYYVNNIPAVYVAGWAATDTTQINGGKIYTNSILANSIAASTITGNKIKAGTITSSLIASNTITAGNIAAGAITSSAVSTNQIISSSSNLGNAVVTTLKIGANQIIIPVYAYTATQQNVTAYNGAANIQRCDISNPISDNITVSISATTNLYYANYGEYDAKKYTINIIKYFNSAYTTLYTSDYTLHMSWVSFTIATKDTLASGAATYYFQIQKTDNSTNSTLSAKNSSLLIMGVMR